MLVLALMSFQFLGGEIETITIGDSAPMVDIEMSGTDKQMHTLTSEMKENGLLVIFSCNTCPFVVGNGDTEGWEGRYNSVQKIADQQSVGMVLVNSNEAKRDKGDSMKDMIARAKAEKLASTYLLDENSALADAFGARTTPHVFLFDNNFELVYTGAIDDNVENAKKVKEEWLKDALKKLGSNQSIDPATTRQKGCSIKRVSK